MPPPARQRGQATLLHPRVSPSYGVSSTALIWRAGQVEFSDVSRRPEAQKRKLAVIRTISESRTLIRLAFQALSERRQQTLAAFQTLSESRPLIRPAIRECLEGRQQLCLLIRTLSEGRQLSLAAIRSLFFSLVTMG